MPRDLVQWCLFIRSKTELALWVCNGSELIILIANIYWVFTMSQAPSQAFYIQRLLLSSQQLSEEYAVIPILLMTYPRFIRWFNLLKATLRLIQLKIFPASFSLWNGLASFLPLPLALHLPTWPLRELLWFPVIFPCQSFLPQGIFESGKSDCDQSEVLTCDGSHITWHVTWGRKQRVTARSQEWPHTLPGHTEDL